jgi:hypothetical protein
MPEYATKSYWENRFTSPSAEPPTGFDWLAPPSVFQDLLLESLAATDPSHLDLADQSIPSPPRILHIGSGTSNLSFELREWLCLSSTDLPSPSRPSRILPSSIPPSAITNVDFSPAAISWGRAREMSRFEAFSAAPNESMVWQVVDLLSPSDLVSTLPSPSIPYSIIIEKSTSDALSCGHPLPLPPLPNFSAHLSAPTSPLASSSASTSVSLLPPIQVLARNLALVTRPSSIWLAMSYSLYRFSDPELLGGLWDVVRCVEVDAPVEEGKEGGEVVGRPTVKHGIWVLRRTAKEMTE